MRLHGVSTVGPVEVGVVQDQPYFETGVGAGNTDVFGVAQSDCLVEIGMIVAVKYGPNFVFFFEGVSFAFAVPDVGRSFRDCEGDAGGGFDDQVH